MKPKWLIAGVLALAELGLCGAIVFVSWRSIDAARSGGLRLRVFEFDAVSAEADEEHRAQVTGPATLDIYNALGTIAVTAGMDSEIVISAHKTAWGPDQAAAEARLAEIKVVVTQTGNAVTVRVEPLPEVTVVGSRRPDKVDFVISVPTAAAVTARSGFGDLTLSGVEGDADLQTSNGAINASDLSGNLTLRSDFGDISVDRADLGRVEIRTSNGQVGLTGVAAAGEVRLSSDFGALRFEAGSAASLDLETDNGAVVLNDLAVSGPVVARTSFGDVTLTGVAARSYNLRSSNGDITVDGASGALQAGSDFGDIGVTGGVDVTLDLRTLNGRIDFAGSLAGGPHMVQSDFGDIVLTLPADADLSVDLKTDFGQINTELPITIAGDAGQSHLRGTVNAGGPNLTVSTSNGSITLGRLGS